MLSAYPETTKAPIPSSPKAIRASVARILRASSKVGLSLGS